ERGICYQEQGEFNLAFGDFSACVVLWPEFGWGHFNRGRILHQMGKNAEAQQDYTEALRRDPELTYACLNRGLVRLDRGQFGVALVDLDSALAGGMDTVALHGGRGIALEHLGRFREADAAFERAWVRDPNNSAMLLGYGFAVGRRLPRKAQAAFARVLER